MPHMPRFSSKLLWLLIIKGACRSGPPIYILWSIVEWLWVDWRYAVGFAALTLNYVIVYILTWTAPALMNGPWRVRPWQTLVLVVNAFLLPIMFRRAYGHLPWLFIAAAILCAASLFIGSAIYLYLHEKSPAGALLAQRQPVPVPADQKTAAG